MNLIYDILGKIRLQYCSMTRIIINYTILVRKFASQNNKAQESVKNKNIYNGYFTNDKLKRHKAHKALISIPLNYG